MQVVLHHHHVTALVALLQAAEGQVGRDARRALGAGEQLQHHDAAAIALAAGERRRLDDGRLQAVQEVLDPLGVVGPVNVGEHDFLGLEDLDLREKCGLGVQQLLGHHRQLAGQLGLRDALR